MSVLCTPLQDASEAGTLGGKAEGLSRLLRFGFEVPPGFVISGASPGDHASEVTEAYKALGEGKVAVRSSSLSEDGVEASYAGQYETVLNVEGPEALHSAVDSCLNSLKSARVAAYEQSSVTDREAQMAVVVQRMVQPRAAGVIFTADPVTNRRDRVVVDAVGGLGEALVSGEATPDHFVVRSSNLETITEELAAGSPLISNKELCELVEGALRAEREFALGPLDLEWAIDEEGRIAWLQARPITTLGPDPSELDTLPPRETDVFTRSNIGEMLPGAITPLTASVTGRGIDLGMQRMVIELGLEKEELDANQFVGVFSGQLFLNLSTLSKMGTHIAGASVERICQAICGRSVPELPSAPLAGLWTRAVGGFRYARYLLGSTRRVGRLRAVVESLACTGGASAKEQWERLEGELAHLWECYAHHLASSTLSGAMTSTIVEIIAQGKPPTDAHHAELARLLAGAEGVESADIAAGLDRLADQIATTPEAAQVSEMTSSSLIEWLTKTAPGEVQAGWKDYLTRHGHRAVRELELREKEWSLDPTPVLAHLKTAVKARVRKEEAGAPTLSLPKIPFGLGLLVKWAHAGVRCREATKSLLVKAGLSFKEGYRSLATLLVEEGNLSDEDAVFFLTHQELGELISTSLPSQEAAKRIEARRRLLPVQQGLALPEVFAGYPEEVVREEGSADEVVGRAVSQGKAQGRVRVATTPVDAQEIQPGEILVAPITDVGWTPCFGVIAGLITDLGSAVSHGAVVAREYGLPCVVNTRLGTKVLKTGDLVEVDGGKGLVRILERAP